LNVSAQEDWARPCAVLRRLRDTPSLYVQNMREIVGWGPFTQLLLDGGLANLK
jgi:hypothetical protein